MNFEDIATFLSLEKTRNFSRTAEILYISQTAVSARIKSLEDDLGRPLFVRNNKSVELTPSGRLFLKYAEEINQIVREGKQVICNLDKYTRYITIAAPDSIWSYPPLLDTLNDFLDSNTHISFKLRCDHSDTIISGILDNEIDIGVTLCKPYHPDITTLPFLESKYLLVATPKLALKENIFSPDTISQFPLIYMNWGEKFNKWYTLHYPLEPFFLEVERVFLFVNLLLSGRGVGFLPKRIANQYLKNKDLVSIEYQYHESLSRDNAYIIFTKNKAPFIAPFLNEFFKSEDLISNKFLGDNVPHLGRELQTSSSRAGFTAATLMACHNFFS